MAMARVVIHPREELDDSRIVAASLEDPEVFGELFRRHSPRLHAFIKRRLELENALLNLKGNWHAVASTPRDEPLRALRGKKRVRALSDVAGALLAEAPAPPKVRAAAFQMLSTLPGVKVEGKADDPLGRSGVLISLPLATTMPLGLYTAPKQLGTYRRQWIINPASGAGSVKWILGWACDGYCGLAHGKVLRDRFYDADSVRDIATDHGTAGLDPVDVALIDFAERVTEDATAITAADIDELHEHGLSDTDIFQVVLAAAARCFFSTVLDAVGAEPDAQYREMIEPELLRVLSFGRPIPAPDGQ